jgi:hypothetical protein
MQQTDMLEVALVTLCLLGIIIRLENAIDATCYIHIMENQARLEIYSDIQLTFRSVKTHAVDQPEFLNTLYLCKKISCTEEKHKILSTLGRIPCQIGKEPNH